MTWNYSQKTTDLFMAAVQGKPGTHLGEIEDPDGFGEHGSIACGDALRFTFRVDRHPDDPLQDRITEARYLTFGCTSAIAASEALCAIIEEGDYTPIEALKITNKDIVSYLEGLPQAKIHCSVMGAEALEAAVFNWAQKRGVDLAELGVDGQHLNQWFAIGNQAEADQFLADVSDRLLIHAQAPGKLDLRLWRYRWLIRTVAHKIIG